MNIKRLEIKRVFLILLMGLFLISGKAVYASDKKVEVPLVIQQHFNDQSGKLNKTEKTGTYTIRSVEDGNPMPENSVNGNYSFNLEDNGTYTIPLYFQKAGIYNYTLNQVVKEKKDYTYDNTAYAVTIYVKNTDSGTLVPEVVVKNGNEKKCSEIGFYNSYNHKQTDTNTTNGKGKLSKVAKTGDTSPLVKWSVFAMLSFAIILVIWKKGNHSVKKDS